MAEAAERSGLTATRCATTSATVCCSLGWTGRPRLALLVAHRERVEAQLAEVTAHLRAIDHKIGTYEGKVEQAVDLERARSR